MSPIKYRDLLIVLPMREPSIFRGIAVSLLRPVIGSNVEIDVIALNWLAQQRGLLSDWLIFYPGPQTFIARAAEIL